MFITGGAKRSWCELASSARRVLFVQTVLANYRPSRRAALLYWPCVINLTFLSLLMEIERTAVRPLCVPERGPHSPEWTQPGVRLSMPSANISLWH